MNKKGILVGLVGIIIFSLLFGYSLVFAGTGVFDSSARVLFKSSENIYLDSLELRNTQILFKSTKNLEDYSIKSECNIFSKLIYKNEDYYMFDLKFLDSNCQSRDFILVDGDSQIASKFALNLLKEYDILSKFYDLDTSKLMQLKLVLDNKIEMYGQYSSFDSSIDANYYNFLEKNRILGEAQYNQLIISNILAKRNEKYIVPVDGHIMPTLPAKVPNSPRLYRSDYTDGIHHGWDIDGDFGEQVIALQEGIIVRVVSKFDFSDLDKIIRGDNISYDTKIRNLDILRGKQVWLKTPKGDVIMYSHLNDIYTNIKVGEVVKKGQPLGAIGITGVPDENYTDYHLHFVVHKNPFIEEKVGIYDIDDYMRWDWEFKGKPIEYVIEHQGEIFE